MVIAKDLRNRLGVKPGWLALQQLAGDHLEVYFLPPEHGESLRGSLAKYIKGRPGPGDEWDRARAAAWAHAAQDRAAEAE